MGVEWVSMLPSIIFSRIKNEFSSKLKTKYKMKSNNFSTVGSSDTPAVFPFVFVEELPCNPNGEDLERNTINGLKDYTLRIRVTDNKSQTRSRDVAYEVLRILQKMQFTCEKPTPDYTVIGVHGYRFKCSRNIDEGDIL